MCICIYTYIYLFTYMSEYIYICIYIPNPEEGLVPGQIICPPKEIGMYVLCVFMCIYIHI
jgi:hypothetical protein